MGIDLRLHQRDNVTPYPPGEEFLREHEELAPLFVRDLAGVSAEVHSRYIYPPYTDGFVGRIAVFHCYGWEETYFPQEYVQWFNSRLNLVTVMSQFVRQVLHQNGVRIPVVPVGLGADHVLAAQGVPVPEVVDGDFIFLHVSSCFPRKAADVLVKAFCQEFSRRENVRLVIKTFDNPHNNLKEVLAETFRDYPAHPPVDVIWRSLAPGEMRWLYEHAGCLVSASRGEGFGLPVAEAMFARCPVIATIYSGQAEMCTPENCWPVEYRLEQARTHLTQGSSLWAEPALHSLRRQMRNVYGATAEERRRRTEAAFLQVQRQFTWRKVAERHLEACKDVQSRGGARKADARKRDGRFRIGFITTWNVRCGIAEYTRYLVYALPEGFEPVVFANHATAVRPDEPFVTRCWEPDGGIDREDHDSLLGEIIRECVDVVSIQFNFGFFSPSRLEGLLTGLKGLGIPCAITMHSTNDPDRLQRLSVALAMVDVCLCHRTEDLMRIKEPGVARKTILQKHGVPRAEFTRVALSERGKRKDSFVISCFGFFLPPKGIHHLLMAFALARRVNPVLRLNLLNALYPIPQSEEYAKQCLRFVEEEGLGGCVSFTTAFLEDRAVISALAASDLVVLPYHYSSESSSAAIRLVLPSLTPVLCSDLGIFDEFADCVHRFPAGDVYALANAILRLSSSPAELNKHRARQAQVVSGLQWPIAAREFASLLKSLRAGRDPSEEQFLSTVLTTEYGD